MVAEAIHQNIVTLHAANGMLNKDTDLTQDALRLIEDWHSFYSCEAFCGGFNLITTIIRLHTKITQIDKDMEVRKPINLWRKLSLQHTVIMVMSTKGAAEKDNAFIR